MESRGHRLTTALLWCGPIAAPLFVAVFLLEGLRAGYDPASLPVSLLAVGPDGWTQVANFILDGVLVVAFAIGLWRARAEGVVRSAAGPQTVITASHSMDPWCTKGLPCASMQAVALDLGDEYAALQPAARHVVVPTSHDVQGDDPDRVVGEIVRLLDAVAGRSNTTSPDGSHP